MGGKQTSSQQDLTLTRAEMGENVIEDVLEIVVDLDARLTIAKEKLQEMGINADDY